MIQCFRVRISERKHWAMCDVAELRVMTLGDVRWHRVEGDGAEKSDKTKPTAMPLKQLPLRESGQRSPKWRSLVPPNCPTPLPRLPPETIHMHSSVSTALFTTHRSICVSLALKTTHMHSLVSQPFPPFLSV